MGLLDSLKDFYFKLEDKWYDLLDRLNKFVPVYKVIDPIDEVVPSFALFGGIFALLVFVFIVLPFLGVVSLPGQSILNLTVVDEKGNALSGVKVLLNVEGKTIEKLTDASGKISLDVAKNARVEAEASKEGYRRSKATLLMTEPSVSQTLKLLSEAALPSGPKTIKFADASGKALTGVQISAELKCSNPGVSLLKDTFTTTTGEITFMPPANCGQVLIAVSAPGYSRDSFAFEEGKVILLSAMDSQNEAKGTVIVSVEDSTGSKVEGVQVTLFTKDNVAVDNKFTSWGEVTFQVTAGKYYASVSDPNGVYTSAKSTTVNVAAKEIMAVTLKVTKEILATISVKPVDSTSSAAVVGATVTLKTPEGEAISTAKVEAGQSAVDFPLEQLGKFIVTAYHDEYLDAEPVEVDVTGVPKGTTKSVEMQLIKMDENNSGRLQVRVVDETGLAVENASVYLEYAEGLTAGFLCDACGSRTTDINGTSEPVFNGLKAGSYVALVQKYPASGKSQPFTVEVKKFNQQLVTLMIGNGTISIKAVDSTGQAVAFADAEIFSSANTSLGKIKLNEQGMQNFLTKADKQVYVKITKTGFAPWVSALYQILPDQNIYLVAKMEQEIIGTTPEIIFDGIFSKTGAKTDVLTAGMLYDARLQLKIPSGLTASQAAVFVRLSDADLVEKSPWVVTKVNAPMATFVKGKNYTAPKGTSRDMASLTNADGLWTNITWTNLGTGVYNFSVEVKVKPTVSEGTPLVLHERAQAVDGSGSYLRAPADSVLGTNKDAADKEELYATTYDHFFFEGAKPDCGGNFCYSERVLDVVQNIFLQESPYAVKLFQDYKVNISITNNSSQLHDNADIRISLVEDDGVTKSNSMDIKAFKITNADAQETQQSNVKLTEIQPVSLGNFSQSKTVTAELTVEPRAVKNTGIKVVIISDSVEVFNKIVKFAPVKAEGLIIEVKPDVFPAFLMFDSDVTVKYAAGQLSGFAVENAKVRMTRIAPDKSETSQIVSTNSNGLAGFVIPASSPGTKFIFKVEVPGYDAQSVEKVISTEVVKFEPESLTSNLNLTTKTEETVNFSLTNLVPIDMTIKAIETTGKYDGLLDEAQMNSWLNQYVKAFALQKDEPRIIQVKTALSDDAALLDTGVQLKGKVLMDVQTTNGLATYSLEVPLTVNIDLSEPPAEPNCLIIEGTNVPNWTTSTQQARAVTEFTIRNACVTQDGKPMPLQNLAAKISWKSNVVGSVELTVADSTGISVSEVLEQSFRRLVGNVPPEAEYFGYLTYVPKPDTIGKEADFEVEIDAQLKTMAGEQYVGSNQKIIGKILNINLEECINITPTPQTGVNIGMGSEGTFNVDTSNCGDIKLDFRFSTVGNLEISPEEIDNVLPDKPFDVRLRRPLIAGIYPVYIDVRPEGSDFRRVAIMDVTIDPTPEARFNLDKYRFSIIGTGTADSGTLTSAPIKEVIEIDASVCDLGQAAKKEGWSKYFDLKTAGIGMASMALMSAGPAIEASMSQSAAAGAAKGGLLSSAWKAIKGAVLSLLPSKTAAAKATAAGQTAVASVTAASATTTAAATGSAVQGCLSTAATAGTADAAAKKAVALATSVGQTLGVTGAGNVAAAATNTNMADGAAKTAAANTKLSTTAAVDDGISIAGEGTAQAASTLGTAGISAATATATYVGAITNWGTVIADLTVAKTNLAAAHAAAAAADSEYNPTCPAAAVALANAMASVDEAIAAATAAKTASTAAATAAGASQAAIAAAQGASITGANAAAGLATAAAPAATRAGFSAGTFAGILGASSAAGFIVGGLAGGLMGEDPCDRRSSVILPDWTLNIVGGDAKQITVGQPGIKGSWNTEEAQLIGDFEKQTVGVVFVNDAAPEQKEPIYTKVTFNATQHVHNKPTIIPNGNDNFGPFNVPDASTINYPQTFMLKFTTMSPRETLVPVNFETLECTSGLEIGRTGAGALPKVKLAAKFIGANEDAINWRSCSADNPDGVYCDGEQLLMVLTKRANMLHDFLEKNAPLQCPENPAEIEIGVITSGLRSTSVSNGKVGIGKSWLESPGGSGVTMYLDVTNKTGSSQNVQAKVTIQPPAGITLMQEQKECVKDVTSLTAGATSTVSCTFLSLPVSNEAYIASADLTSSTGAPLDQTATFSFSFTVQSDGVKIPTFESGVCYLDRTTKPFEGRPIIEYFVEAMGDNVQWTGEIPSMLTLREVLQFNALMRGPEGYSEDLMRDFGVFYTEMAFADAPAFFTAVGVNASGNRYGFNKYFLTPGKIKVWNKYVDSHIVPSAGTYKMNLVFDFDPTWKLFKSDGTPTADLTVLFQRIDDAYPNWPFYSMPMDGLLGLTAGNSFDRQGYGMAYDNTGDLLKVNDDVVSGVETRTYPDAGSNPIRRVQTLVIKDLRKLNTAPITRGAAMIAEVDAAGGTQNTLSILLSKATPALMKVHSELTNEPFGAVYIIQENDVPTEVGESLVPWSGAGACLNFDGTMIGEAFSQKYDEHAVPADRIDNWEKAYAVRWQKAERAGDVYLKTIFYTPQTGKYALRSLKENVNFLTTEQTGQLVNLDGITEFSDNTRIDSMEDVFKLVEEGVICVSNSGDRAKFFWNPKAIMEQQGRERGIEETAASLVAGQNCIGQ